MKTKKEKLVKCPRCGEMKPENEVYEREDPYQAEINDIHDEILMCNSCEYESAGDI